MNPGESPDDISGIFFFPPTKKSKNSPKTIPKKQGIFWIGISEFGQKGTDLEISLMTTKMTNCLPKKKGSFGGTKINSHLGHEIHPECEMRKKK